MSEATQTGPSPQAPSLHVSPGPHLSRAGVSTRWMMLDVLIALAPICAMAAAVFGWYAVKQVGICVLTCLAAEYVFHTSMRRKPCTLGDLSAAVTGVILGLSLPWSAPAHVGVVASAAAIGLGKVLFGGLGMNIFNPAMVGRAFVMISFSVALGAGALVDQGLAGPAEPAGSEAESRPAGEAPAGRGGFFLRTNELGPVRAQATPMTAGKTAAESVRVPGLWPLFVGNVNGSLGETSALLCLLGGLYLCFRRTASWQIPAGALLAVIVLGGLAQAGGLYPKVTLAHHLLGGSLLFGAFFIATDPVSSPLTPRGKFLFGAGFGALVMVLRLFSGYPEGVMFAVLLMNGLVPLINTWTIPRPVGGPVPARK